MEDILLRSVRPSDFEFISSMKEDKTVTERLSVDAADITMVAINDNPIGFIKYSLYDEGVYELQLAISHQYRGMGYGTKALDTVTQNLFRNLPDCEKTILVIKNDNGTSTSTAVRNGYSIDYDITESMIKSGELTNGYVYSKYNPYVMDRKRSSTKN